METTLTKPTGLCNLYTSAEAAEYLRCDTISLWRMRKAGKLKAIKAGGKVLYSESALKDFVTNNTEGSQVKP